MLESGPCEGGASAASTMFVDWEELFVSHDRGSRVVHYRLKDQNGGSCLAVVGMERSLRHMVYTVCDGFLLLAGLDKSNTPAVKWRSRREVLDWLATFITRLPTLGSERQISKSPKHDSEATSNDDTDFFDGSSQDEGRLDMQNSTSFMPTKEVVWRGPCWTCRKRLHHYESFQRNGITISINSFVYVMSEGNEHHIAYIEDMYEDKKHRKKVRVRWFHKRDELVGPVPPPAPHAREIFMTPFPQVLSVECVDGGAIILTPNHYEKCSLTLPDFAAQVHLCFRQFDNEGIKPFDISGIKGYWDQKLLTMLDCVLTRDCSRNDPLSDSTEVCEEEETNIGTVIKRGPRAARSSRKRTVTLDFPRAGSSIAADLTPHHLTYGNTVESRPGFFVSGTDTASVSGRDHWHLKQQNFFRPGDKIELLCEDSGVRGCWFRCTVLAGSSRNLKVRYEDLEEQDGRGKLEEWVSAVKVAAPDKLGLRSAGRLTVRPTLSVVLPAGSCDVGDAVDAWWNDGWWEGLIVSTEADGAFLVYFPDENDVSLFQASELRHSKDWFDCRWIDAKRLRACDFITEKISALYQSRLSPGKASKDVSEDSKRTLSFGDSAVKCIINGLRRHALELKADEEHAQGTQNICCDQPSTAFASTYDQAFYTAKGLDAENARGERSSGLCQQTSRKRPLENEVVVRKLGKSTGMAPSDEAKVTKDADLLATENLKELNKNKVSKSVEDISRSKRAQPGQENAVPVHGASVNGSIFNAVPFTSLVMSR